MTTSFQLAAEIPSLVSLRTSAGLSWRYVTPLQLANGLRAFNARKPSTASNDASLEYLIGLATRANATAPQTSRDAQFAEARRQLAARKKALQAKMAKTQAASAALAAAIEDLERQIQSALMLADFFLAALLLLILTDLLNQLAGL